MCGGSLLPIHDSAMGCWDCGLMQRADPFADANAEDSSAGTKEYMHVRVQQRNGRKSLTTLEWLKNDISYNKILKDLKKEFCCQLAHVSAGEIVAGGRKILRSLSNLRTKRSRNSCMRDRSW